MTGKSSSTFEVKQFPGLFDDPANITGQDIGNKLLNLSQGVLGTQQPGVQGPVGSTNLANLSNIAQESQFFQPLQDQILRPQFGPQTQAEQDLLNVIEQRTGGANALRGIGSPTSNSLARAIAPSLIGFNQSRTNNLLNAFSTDFQSHYQLVPLILTFQLSQMPLISSSPDHS